MGLVIRGNYVLRSVIFVIFMGFGGAKRWRDAFGVAVQATKGGGGGGQF